MQLGCKLNFLPGHSAANSSSRMPPSDLARWPCKDRGRQSSSTLASRDLPWEEHKLERRDFVGRTVLAEQKAKGVAKKCIAFKVEAKAAPPRPHYPIWSVGADPSRIGEVVSGTQSPSLGVGIGMGYVPPAIGKPGTP